MIRGLIFSKYGTLAASTRQRFVQAMPYLAKEGITVDLQPLFDNAYLGTLFTQDTRKPLHVLEAYRTRLMALLRCRNYDFLWVHCELLPYLPGGIEALVRFTGKPVIYDYDDAIFHQYDQHPNALVRWALGKKLVPLLKQSAVAFCGNAYLEAYASRYCKHTEIIPTTVDTNIYLPKPEKMESSKPTLGWIGSPSTWNYCLPLTDMFTSFVRKDQLSLLVVGAGKQAARYPDFEFRDWEEKREVADIQQMDIGIMPMPDEPWARGKCGYKLIQYLACGIPVIASPVGVNRDIVEHGVNGFLASTETEWRDAITQLQADASLRKQMGLAGRERVERDYSIQRQAPRIAAAIHIAVNGFSDSQASFGT